MPPFLTWQIVHAFISSRLDYCHALFAEVTKQTLNKLQIIQNSAARVLTGTIIFFHSIKITPLQFFSPVLKSLHWLPVKQRIYLKILLIVFKSLNGLAPSYSSDMVTAYTPARCLQYSSKGLLSIPRINTNSAHGAFSHYAPTLWNSLPSELFYVSPKSECVYTIWNVLYK